MTNKIYRKVQECTEILIALPDSIALVHIIFNCIAMIRYYADDYNNSLREYLIVLYIFLKMNYYKNVLFCMLFCFDKNFKKYL